MNLPFAIRQIFRALSFTTGDTENTEVHEISCFLRELHVLRVSVVKNMFGPRFFHSF